MGGIAGNKSKSRRIIRNDRPGKATNERQPDIDSWLKVSDILDYLRALFY